MPVYINCGISLCNINFKFKSRTAYTVFVDTYIRICVLHATGFSVMVPSSGIVFHKMLMMHCKYKFVCWLQSMFDGTDSTDTCK